MNDEWSWKIYECENLKQKPAVQWGSQVPYYISEVMMMELSSFHFCSVGQLRNEVVAHFPFPFLKEPNLNSRHTCSEKNWDNHVTKFLENAVDK